MDWKWSSLCQPLILLDSFDGPVWSHCFQRNLEPLLSKHLCGVETLLLSAAMLTLGKRNMDGRSETVGECFNQSFGKDCWGFQDCFLLITITGCLPRNIMALVLGWRDEWEGPQMLLWLTLLRLSSENQLFRFCIWSAGCSTDQFFLCLFVSY